MEHVDGVSPVEHFVIHEADSDALLWELAASWTENGTPDQRRNAVPLLRDAVLSLAARGFVEVYIFPSWPPQQEQATQVAGTDLERELADPQNWLWLDQRTSLLTVSLTDAGVPYL